MRAYAESRDYFPTETPKRYAIYARVSTFEQVDGYSIDGQIDRLHDYVHKNGSHVVDVYTDKGITGTSIEKRRSLQQLIEDAGKGLFDAVAVWKISRLARNNRDLLNILHVLEKNNIVLISISENIDTNTASGKLVINVMGMLAEIERDGIAQNVKLGMSQRAREGYKNGGKMLGYRSEGSGKDGRLVIVEREAMIIRMIYDSYLEGKGYKAIANQINKMGFRTINGNLFAVTQISDILSNPTYTGLIRFNNFVDWDKKRRKGYNPNPIIVEGRHEGIIDRDTWDRVQEIKEQRGKLRHRGPKNGKFPLTGLLKCPECGASMCCGGTTSTRKDGTKVRTDYYVCGSFSNKGSVACHANSVRVHEANDYVFKRIQDVFNNDVLIKQLVDEYNNSNESLSAYEAQSEALVKKLKELDAKRNRIFDLFEDSSFSKDDLRDRLNKLAEEKAQCETELGLLKEKIRSRKVSKVPFRTVKEAMNNLAKVLKTADADRKKMFLELAISKITISPERKVDSIKIRLTNQTCKVIKLEQPEESSNEDSSSFVFETIIN